MSAIPLPDPRKERARKRVILTGDVPGPVNPPSGCRFRTRCPTYASLGEADRSRCVDEPPPLLGDGHSVACHYPAILTGDGSYGDGNQSRSLSGGRY
jgi:oligopeptide/dipeptide ABC transporter ATP-binding protein